MNAEDVDGEGAGADPWDRATDAERDALADAELDALAAAEEPEPGVRPPSKPGFRWPPPARVYDRQLAVLTPGDVGEFLRACRASAGLSQRQVAEAAGISQSTVARLEAGLLEDVKLSTVVRLAEECDVVLVGTTATHAPLIETDLAQRHRDRGGRLMPAHLFNAPYVSATMRDARRGRRGIPTRTYFTSTKLRDVADD